jgi:hypothetical protein
MCPLAEVAIFVRFLSRFSSVMLALCSVLSAIRVDARSCSLASMTVAKPASGTYAGDPTGSFTAKLNLTQRNLCLVVSMPMPRASSSDHQTRSCIELWVRTRRLAFSRSRRRQGQRQPPCMKCTANTFTFVPDKTHDDAPQTKAISMTGVAKPSQA